MLPGSREQDREVKKSYGIDREEGGMQKTPREKRTSEGPSDRDSAWPTSQNRGHVCHQLMARPAFQQKCAFILKCQRAGGSGALSPGSSLCQGCYLRNPALRKMSQCVPNPPWMAHCIGVKVIPNPLCVSWAFGFGSLREPPGRASSPPTHNVPHPAPLSKCPLNSAQ